MLAMRSEGREQSLVMRAESKEQSGADSSSNPHILINIINH
jgi:hypothetical protein